MCIRDRFHSKIVNSIEPEEDVERRRLMGAHQHALIALSEKERRRNELETLQRELNDLEGNDDDKDGVGVAATSSSDVATRDEGPGLSLIHISEPTRLLSISYAVFCLKKKKKK
eukprot:TRINITY_DN8460_c0_g1_i2.p1 TRINITY_DN8460_c0_g1~~TRINITY_DN8460_c0_g1_i2.p1  ORF type:complete len:114 (+),score=38.71 TRINITY_DN8460_c0_g1_i2:164-505(+)